MKMPQFWLRKLFGQSRLQRFVRYMAIALAVCYILSATAGYAERFDFARINTVKGGGIFFREGTKQSRNAKKNDELRNENQTLTVPGNGAAAFVDLLFDSPADRGGMPIRLGPHRKFESTYRFPCTTVGGSTTLGWMKGKQTMPCGRGYKFIKTGKQTGKKKQAAADPFSAVAQATKGLLYTQVTHEVTLIPPNIDPTLVQAYETDDTIAINTTQGDILVQSAKHPQGKRIPAGRKYLYPQDIITDIDASARQEGADTQDFLNPANWALPELPARLADSLAKQLALHGGNRSTPVTTAAAPVAGAKNLVSGTSYGDPHIITFDGLRYSFQMVGEFTLVKSKDGRLDIQVRQGPVPGQDVSLNTGVAMKVGNTRVAFYSKNFPDGNASTPLRVNGKPVTLESGSLPLSGGGSITQSGGDYIVQWQTGEQLRVHKIQVAGTPFMNITPAVAPQAGQYVGLLGNLDGNSQNDLQTRNGKVIPVKENSTYGLVSQALGNLLPTPVPLSQVETLFFDQLYKEFGNSWRINQAESLFDYASGQTTANFTDRTFPHVYRALSSLMPAQVRQAEAICRQAGVDANLLEGCIFDVGNTGQSGFASAAANALTDAVKQRALGELRNRLPIPVPIPF